MTSKTKALMALKKETADLVLQKVQHFQNNKELDLPPDYSAANALKSAWLILQDVKDKNKKPALTVCSKPSVANALLDMVIQGLNPAKKQCYFIVYGTNLTLSRSYFGTKAVAMRANPKIADITEQVIYRGDELTMRIERGQRFIDKHTQAWDNIDDSKISGAYAEAIGEEGNVLRCEVMTIDQIKQAWKQSPMNPITDKGNIKAASTHGKFTGEMAKRTVINRLCKHIINTSNDSDLVIESVKRTDDVMAKAEAEEEVEDYANSEVIDVGGPEPETIDVEPPEIESTGKVVDAEFDAETDGELTPEEIEEIRQQELAEAEAEEDDNRGPNF